MPSILHVSSLGIILNHNDRRNIYFAVRLRLCFYQVVIMVHESESTAIDSLGLLAHAVENAGDDGGKVYSKC